LASQQIRKLCVLAAVAVVLLLVELVVHPALVVTEETTAQTPQVLRQIAVRVAAAHAMVVRQQQVPMELSISVVESLVTH
jgi:hypothetical protein